MACGSATPSVAACASCSVGGWVSVSRCSRCTPPPAPRPAGGRPGGARRWWWGWWAPPRWRGSTTGTGATGPRWRGRPSRWPGGPAGAWSRSPPARPVGGAWSWRSSGRGVRPALRQRRCGWAASRRPARRGWPPTASGTPWRPTGGDRGPRLPPAPPQPGSAADGAHCALLVADLLSGEASTAPGPCRAHERVRSVALDPGGLDGDGPPAGFAYLGLEDTRSEAEYGAGRLVLLALPSRTVVASLALSGTPIDLRLAPRGRGAPPALYLLERSGGAGGVVPAPERGRVLVLDPLTLDVLGEHPLDGPASRLATGAGRPVGVPRPARRGAAARPGHREAAPARAAPRARRGGRARRRAPLPREPGGAGAVGPRRAHRVPPSGPPPAGAPRQPRPGGAPGRLTGAPRTPSAGARSRRWPTCGAPPSGVRSARAPGLSRAPRGAPQPRPHPPARAAPPGQRRPGGGRSPRRRPLPTLPAPGRAGLRGRFEGLVQVAQSSIDGVGQFA